jgi:hypothetical protein
MKKPLPLPFLNREQRIYLGIEVPEPSINKKIELIDTLRLYQIAEDDREDFLFVKYVALLGRMPQGLLVGSKFLDQIIEKTERIYEKYKHLIK